MRIDGPLHGGHFGLERPDVGLGDRLGPHRDIGVAQPASRAIRAARSWSICPPSSPSGRTLTTPAKDEPRARQRWPHRAGRRPSRWERFRSRPRHPHIDIIRLNILYIQRVDLQGAESPPAARSAQAGGEQLLGAVGKPAAEADEVGLVNLMRRLAGSAVGVPCRSAAPAVRGHAARREAAALLGLVLSRGLKHRAGPTGTDTSRTPLLHDRIMDCALQEIEDGR